ncbi:IS30 family transposase [Peptoniphilus equinus]|uniref:IS30 family transposase n=1 Tax=Peptoniphilus equinus TaxID=3016343 RepID=A0ABY7QVG4_9FIRM|nr:IS30 family transposase [Peptoniphilus equinus]WBW50777.1 IS30 family transposase [Peptoniphilus equinus]
MGFHERYKRNKSKCGRTKKELSPQEKEYVDEKIKAGWTPDVIVGRGEIKLSMSSRTLYRRFKDSPNYDPGKLPMKGKRKKNGHKEKRGKQSFKRSLEDRAIELPAHDKEFGHLEGDTIIGKDHKSAVITLVERLSKAIITLKPKGRTAKDVENRLNEWLSKLQKNLFKSITFD